MYVSLSYLEYISESTLISNNNSALKTAAPALCSRLHPSQFTYKLDSMYDTREHAGKRQCCYLALPLSTSTEYCILTLLAHTAWLGESTANHLESYSLLFFICTMRVKQTHIRLNMSFRPYDSNQESLNRSGLNLVWTLCMHEEQPDFEECLLPFGSESFVFPPVV
jgi:hypothetical protein